MMERRRGDFKWPLTEQRLGYSNSPSTSQQLAISTNGGKSFSVRPEPGLNGAATCQLTATSTTSLWATCAQGNALSGLSYSDDGGVHWMATGEYGSTSGRHAFISETLTP